MQTMAATQSSYCLRETPFGPVALLWSVCGGEPKIQRVLLSRPHVSVKEVLQALFSEAISSTAAEVDLLADQIAAFLRGEDIGFSLSRVRLDLCSSFQQQVLRAEHGIPRGQVSTYQRIAAYLGNANGARAVGAALANNPFPIIIPCHRAIRSDGTLGGYQGGIKMKRTLLGMEGVLFDAMGRVVTGARFY